MSTRKSDRTHSALSTPYSKPGKANKRKGEFPHRVPGIKPRGAAPRGLALVRDLAAMTEAAAAEHPAKVGRVPVRALVPPGGFPPAKSNGSPHATRPAPLAGGPPAAPARTGRAAPPKPKESGTVSDRSHG